LSVGVVQIKLNNKAKYVELSVADLRTGVRFPPAPPFKCFTKHQSVSKA